MANNFKFKLNSKGVKDLMKSNRMQSICQENANSIISATGRTDYKSSVFRSATRVNVNVKPDSDEAYKDIMDNNTLEKAIQMVRK
ncbi:hypothetical protein [Anaerofustis stercorihominis]|uniref:Uncharacterized protein n=1 Tax=Anaerofustis stercorihominis TaxID=214853 RepID=A0A3E3DUK5_9FIRM|nr:hypothetical protein [Anaerofustis stercorihominis]RGD72911.1 hypothetical protein DW687_11755 [Anaerofustis stercorihominis]